FASDDNTPAVKIAASAPVDQFRAFFSRPDVGNAIPTLAKEKIIQLSYELCDNAFKHGRARHVQLKLDDSVFQIIDDGSPFDPLVDLRPEKFSAKSHVGSYICAQFFQQFGNSCHPCYARTE